MERPLHFALKVVNYLIHHLNYRRKKRLALARDQHVHARVAHCHLHRAVRDPVKEVGHVQQHHVLHRRWQRHAFL